MSAALLVGAIALPVVAAYVVLGRVMPLEREGLALRALRLGLAIPLALGAASILTYVWLVAGGTLTARYAWVDAIVFATPLAIAIRRRGHRGLDSRAERVAAVDLVAISVTAVVLLLVAAAFVKLSMLEPHGGWDAWAIWNHRARFLYRGAQRWRAAFGPAFAFSHNEYPLLLPCAIARVWAFSGETVLAPAVVAGLFTLSPVFVVFGVIARRAGYAPAAAAALLLMATEGWVSLGAMQYADVPLACFVVASAAAVIAIEQVSAPELRARFLVVAGAFLGFAAWTKEEGFMLAAVFGAWAVLRGALPSPARRAAALAGGAIIPLLVRVHFQATLAPGFASDFTRSQTIGTSISRAMQIDRWQVIFAEIPKYVPGAGTWLPLVAVAVAGVLGASWRLALRSAMVPAMAAYGVFLAVYAITPQDLHWHINTSAARVLLQPWPAFLVGAFELIRRTGDRGAVGSGVADEGVTGDRAGTARPGTASS